MRKPITAMALLAVVAGASVTVLCHPSLQGINSGSGISGSTAWHGAFRFRQYLRGVKAVDGEQPDSEAEAGADMPHAPEEYLAFQTGVRWRRLAELEGEQVDFLPT